MKRIVWPFDAFASAPEPGAPVLSTLAALARNGAQVQPVYVFSPLEFELPLELSPDWARRYEEPVRKALGSYLSRVTVPHQAPELLVHSQSSLTGATRALARWADEQRADAIVLASHGRHGLPRLFLGSFAETLLFEARVPVLVVGPQAKVGSKFGTVLFATDFSEGSHAAFERACETARDLGAELEIFHAIAHPAEPVVQSGVYLLSGGWLSVPEFLTSREADLQKVADKWIEQARAKQVVARARFERGVSSVVESVLARAHSLPDSMVALASQSGKTASALLGSVAREIVRSADRPVLVMRA